MMTSRRWRSYFATAARGGSVTVWVDGVVASSVVAVRGMAVLAGVCGSADDLGGAVSGNAFCGVCAMQGAAASEAAPISVNAAIVVRKLISKLHLELA
jgi:hypothetical protein